MQRSKRHHDLGFPLIVFHADLSLHSELAFTGNSSNAEALSLWEEYASEYSGILGGAS
jgi:hypothetical protein